MADDFVKFGWAQAFGDAPSTDQKVYGVAVATVIGNFDATGEARVQLLLPWLPGFTPWARLATLMAGTSRGSFFVPQIGDEVLVAFNQGDVREPFVIGSLWNTIDRPPALSPTEAISRRKIRTPLGHELDFDDAAQSVTLKANSLSQVTLDAEQATLSSPGAKVKVGKAGDVTISAATKLTIDASVIEINAKTALKINGASVVLSASGNCVVQAALIKLN